MTAQSSTEWNPRWLAFLAEKGLTTEQADAMARDRRISLNAEFMCWWKKLPSKYVNPHTVY